MRRYKQKEKEEYGYVIMDNLSFQYLCDIQGVQIIIIAEYIFTYYKRFCFS